MVIAALIINAAFGGLGLIPTGKRPSRGDIFGSIHLDYKLALNILGLIIFTALMYITARRGVTDPVCGMKVDRAKTLRKDVAGETYHFCSEHCLHAFEAQPEQYIAIGTAPTRSHTAHAP
jgi:YHS domain-containing protein